jgi:hypothetical protein
MFIGGTGQQVSEFRAQESWGPNVVVDGQNHLTAGPMIPAACGRHTRRASALMSARPGLLFLPTAQKNVIKNMFYNGSVHPNANYGTHAVYFLEGADKNLVEIDEQIDIAAYYGSGTGVWAPGRRQQ